MKAVLKLVLPIIVLGAYSSSADAQVMSEGDNYVIDDASGNKRIIGAVGGEMMPVMRHENGSAPMTCAYGAYWENSSGDLLSCAGSARYRPVRPGAGATMSNGKPYPAGAMVLEEQS